MTFAEQWQQYRRLRATVLVLAIGLLPWSFAMGLVAARLRPPMQSAVILVGVGGWLVAVWFTGMRLSFWRCPRCGKPFGRRPFGGTKSNKFLRECVHCGLPKYAERG
jgi:hypothetical protein